MAAQGNLSQVGAMDVRPESLSAPNPVPGGNQWFPYFGEPSGDLKLNAFDRYKHETYDLPEAYKGQCLYLRDTMDGLIVEGNNDWYTTVALPWIQTEHMHIAWNEFHFNQTLAGRVPHEGVSRLISSSKRGHKESVVRRGIAMVLEHGFMNTPEGQEQYRRNLIGIRTCVQETANHDVMQAYLSCKHFDRAWEAKHGYHELDLQRVLEQEVNSYMLVQKSADGLDILVEQMRQHMSRHGVSPDMIIFPPGMSLHLTMVNPEQTEYWIAGPDGTKIKKQGPRSLTNYRGMQVFETRTFDVADDVPAIDLLRQNRCVGEYYVMTDEYAHQGAAGYASCHRDIVVYNESTDNWHKISLMEAIDNCQVFEPRKIHNPKDPQTPLEGPDGGQGFLRSDGRLPPFLKLNGDKGTQPATLFGDVNEEYMDARTVKRVADSAAASLMQRMPDRFPSVVADLVSILGEINRHEVDTPDYARYLSRCFAESGSNASLENVAGRNLGRALLLSDGDFNGSMLYGTPNDGLPGFVSTFDGLNMDKLKVAPVGFGSFNGMQKLAGAAGGINPFRADLASRVKEAMKDFGLLSQHVKAAFPHSRLFDEEAGFSWMPQQQGAVLFDNCVAAVGDPLWLDAKIYGLKELPSFSDISALGQDTDGTMNAAPLLWHSNRPNDGSAETIFAKGDAAAAIYLAVMEKENLRVGADFTAWPTFAQLKADVKAAVDKAKTDRRAVYLYSNHYYRLFPVSAADDSETATAYKTISGLEKRDPRSIASQPGNSFGISAASQPEYPYLPQALLRGQDTTAPPGWMELCMPLCSTYGMKKNLDKRKAHLMHPFRFGTPTQSRGMEPENILSNLEAPDEQYAGGNVTGSNVDKHFSQGFVLTGSRLADPAMEHPMVDGVNGHTSLGNTSLALSACTWHPVEAGPGAEQRASHARVGGRAQQHEEMFDPEEAAEGFFGAGAAAGGSLLSAGAHSVPKDKQYPEAKFELKVDSFHRYGLFSERGLHETMRGIEVRTRNKRKGYGAGVPEGMEDLSDKETIEHWALHRRWREVCMEPNDITTMYTKAFLMSPLSKDSLVRMIDRDVVVPFDFVLSRPFIQHEMSSMIMTVAGQETGATFFGHSDFQLADDVTSKVHYGNFTFYSKALVTNPKNVHVVDGVYAQAYVKGNDCRFFENAETRDGKEADFNPHLPNNYDKSMFSMMVPCRRAADLPNPLDLGGSYAKPDTSNGTHSYTLSQHMEEQEKKMGELFGFYNELWRFDQYAYSNGFSSPGVFEPGMRARANTLCYQGHQFSWARTGSGLDGAGGYTNVRANTGHFGPDVYPGCGQVRRGHAKVLERQGWNRCSVPV